MGSVGFGGAGGDNVGHQVGKVVGWGQAGIADETGRLGEWLVGSVQNIFSGAGILETSKVNLNTEYQQSRRRFN